MNKKNLVKKSKLARAKTKDLAKPIFVISAAVAIAAFVVIRSKNS